MYVKLSYVFCDEANLLCAALFFFDFFSQLFFLNFLLCHNVDLLAVRIPALVSLITATVLKVNTHVVFWIFALGDDGLL